MPPKHLPISRNLLIRPISQRGNSLYSPSPRGQDKVGVAAPTSVLFRGVF